MALLIKNGEIVTSADRFVGDVYIEGSSIAAVGTTLDAKAGDKVIDASGLTYTDSYAVQRGQPLAMIGLKLDFLTSGCRYDLHRRVGIAPQHATRIDPLMEPAVVEEAPSEATPVGMRDGE